MNIGLGKARPNLHSIVVKSIAVNQIPCLQPSTWEEVLGYEPIGQDRPEEPRILVPEVPNLPPQPPPHPPHFSCFHHHYHHHQRDSEAFLPIGCFHLEWPIALALIRAQIWA